MYGYEDINKNAHVFMVRCCSFCVQNCVSMMNNALIAKLVLLVITFIITITINTPSIILILIPYHQDEDVASILSISAGVMDSLGTKAINFHP